MDDLTTDDDDLARVATLMDMDPTQVVTVTAGELQRMVAAATAECYRQIAVGGEP